MIAWKSAIIIPFISLTGAVFGLLFGAFLGGNFGFPRMFGLVGYESAGISFTILGSLFAGCWAAYHLEKLTWKSIIIAFSVGLVIMLIAFSCLFYIAWLQLLLIIFLPLLLTILVKQLK